MASRRRSVHVNLADCDIEEQRRALDRILQEKTDREMAMQIQREEDERNANPRPAPAELRPAPADPRPAVPGPVRGVAGGRGGARVIQVNRTPYARRSPPIRARPAVNNAEDVQVVYEENSEDEDETITLNESDGDSEDDDDDIEEVNHILQPLFDDDAVMYRHELRLFDPDGQATTSAGAAAALRTPDREGVADGQWGDCTLCFEVPKDPKGCNACLQIIGCKTCINNWQSATSTPSCPLCRHNWIAGPAVSAMPVIDRRRRTRDRQRATSASTPAITPAATPATTTGPMTRRRSALLLLASQSTSATTPVTIPATTSVNITITADRLTTSIETRQTRAARAQNRLLA